MITDTEFVETLRNSKLTTVELADGLGVSQPTIRRWRNGRNLPYMAMRPSILYFLGDNSKERRRMGTVNRLQRAGIDAYDSTEGLNGRMPKHF